MNTRRRVCLVAIWSVAIVFLLWAHRQALESPHRRVGATATVVEISSGCLLAARIDTGAALCSIHFEDLEIEEESADPHDHIGQAVRFKITDRQGQSHWIESRIVDYATIRTSAEERPRYFVSLWLRLQGMEKAVVVTLNDRTDMKYPLLIGRNFLRDSFVVDVARDSEEFD